MNKKEIHLTELRPDRAEIFRAMGSEGYVPDQNMKDLVDKYLLEATQNGKACFGFSTYNIKEVTARSLILEEVTINSGSIITPYLKDADRIAIFVATAGAEFDALLHSVKAEGDILAEFILDAIGSELAEATVREAVKGIEEYAGTFISNPYSPGYCGWNIKEQQAVFSLFPPTPCGITLSSSYLMSPIKSVSGIVAIGDKVTKQPYGCEICNKKNCYKKRT